MIHSRPTWKTSLRPGEEFLAVLFDLDGVLTPTTSAHMAAWTHMFDAYFESHGIVPPFTDADYFANVDGRPRYDGVAAVLASRGVALPWGSPDDAPGTSTVCALGNAKDAAFDEVLRRDGVSPYPASLRLARELREASVATAVVSSSHAARAVLTAAGMIDLFDVIMDGYVALERSLPGKPAPDTYLDTASALGVNPADAVVIEDAVSGVSAAASGEFGLVIGVDRGAGREALMKAGAHLVVGDLDEVLA